MNYATLFLLSSISCYPMHHEPVTVVELHRQDARSEYSPDSLSDEDIVCNAAMHAYERHKTSYTPCIRHYIVQVLQTEKDSPLVNLHDISRGIVQARSSDFGEESNANMEYIYDIVLRASARALEDQQMSIHRQSMQIERRWSRKKSIIATVLSSLITAGVTIAVSLTTKK